MSSNVHFLSFALPPLDAAAAHTPTSSGKPWNPPVAGHSTDAAPFRGLWGGDSGRGGGLWNLQANHVPTFVAQRQRRMFAEQPKCLKRISSANLTAVMRSRSSAAPN